MSEPRVDSKTSAEVLIVRAVIERLVAKRKERGLSQRNVAWRMSMTTGILIRIEGHRHSPPRLETVIKYAHVVGLPLDHLLVSTAPSVPDARDAPDA